MREKWDKKSEKTINDGQPVPQRLTYMSEPMYKPKLLLKSPSLRAIKNYNNLSIQDNTQSSFDNLSFIPESENNPSKYDEPFTISSMSNYSNPSDTLLLNTYDVYDYANTIRSSSGRTSTGSELGSERAEMGSTVKLVQSKMEMSFQTWCTRLKTILCTISLAANFGNLYRLPQVVLLNGGLPFLVAYIILAIIIGLPLVFLELGIGQLAQEGFIKSWRAVPFFRGVGYVKLLAGCLLCIYFPLYIGMALYYVIWLAKEQGPFQECKVVKLTQNGYLAEGIPAEKCLQKTFLESPSAEPEWYGIYAGLLFLTWIVIMILSIRRTKSFTRSLSILLFPTIACYIALTVKAAFTQSEYRSSNTTLNSSKWTVSNMTNFNFASLYENANVWYFAAIQVFFSTHVGFGTFVTNAGIIYNKVNPLWTAVGYIFTNILLGVGSVILCNILSVHVDPTDPGNIYELHLMRLIYSITINSEHADSWKWAIVAYLGILLAGFISMATITYSLLKAIVIQNKRRLKWWQTSVVLSFIGFVFGCAALLVDNFQIVHLLDHYVVGNLILITVILELLALMAFYGTERIRSDFEFMLGHILSRIWIVLWWISPIILLAIFAWGLATIPLEGTVKVDSAWLYGTGWGVVLTATIYIFVVGLKAVIYQDGYTFIDKLKSSLKPSSKWGPKDPIMRHNWIQWNSKAQQGERDFTLKRRGTREYTKSVKRNAKKVNIAASSDLSTTTASGEYHKRDEFTESNGHIPNGHSNFTEPYYLNSNHTTLIRVNGNAEYSRPLRVNSLADPLDPNIQNYGSEIRTSLNPLARSNTYSGTHNLDNNSEGYGTFRKGPYVIGDNAVQHVCHRKYSQSEDATEL